MNQDAFAAALLDPALPAPDGLRAWNGSDPARRFQVYRNNVIVGLVDALADTYGVTRELVGEEFFRAMARLYAYARPPGSPVLAFYGADFPDFIAHFPPAAGLPYLADVARLEYRRVIAYHAADIPGIGADAVATALGDEAALPRLEIALHPSLSVLASEFAIVSLWAAHQGLLTLAEVVPESPEAALVLRHELTVEVIRIAPAAARFIEALRAGHPLGAAAGAALATDAGFDLGGSLGLLLQKSAITGLSSPRSLP